jgi:mono/diheme cytochrome c family protein
MRTGLLLLALSLAPAVHAASPDGVEFYEKKIRPLLHEHCNKCHGADPKKVRGGLLLTTRAGLLKGGDLGPAFIAGKPNESRLIHAVRHADGTKPMPPKGKLSPAAIADLEQWVKMGVPMPGTDGPAVIVGIDWKKARDFWSFRPVKRPDVPTVKGDARNPIDRFLLAKIEAAKIAPTAEASPATLVRRVTFGLTGLPPTPEEVEAFVNDKRPDAYDRLVQRLLASPRFGERWARHWLDVARYAEDQAHTFEVKPYTSAWRYRDWVIDAFNRDMAYDRFVKLQIAADLMPGTPRDDKAGLGFFGLGAQYYKNTDKARAIADELDDRVDTLARGFLGLTVSCARCHDHKFDPVPTQDYYSIAGVFHSSRLADVAMCPDEELSNFNAAQGRVRAADTAMKAFLKREKVKANEVKKLPAEKQKAWKGLREALNAAKKAVPPQPPVAHGLAEAKSEDLKVYVRGNPATLGPVAPRRFLRVIAGDDPTKFKDGSGRRELAEAIASKDNPLTARVIVNRLWQHHFGRGIVGTPSNFGSLGEKPTHPELLDWLAAELVESGWSLKHIHRLIVTSAAYRRSSTTTAGGEKADPDNQLLWRANRRRLEVEAWRDSLLSVSGQLDSRFGGQTGNLGSSAYRRRTIYAKVSRHELDSLLRLFDFPDANITSEKRTETTVPQQQLFVLNSPFFLSQAEAMAARAQKEGSTQAERIVRAHRLAFGRDPLPDEVKLAELFLASKDSADEAGKNRLTRWVRYAQVLLASNEFIYID